MNGNGVRDHCDELKIFSKITGQAVQQVGVDRKGQHHNLGAVPFQEFPDAKVGRLVDENRVLDQRKMMAGDIKKIPKSGKAVDQGQVQPTEEIVHLGAGFRKGIRNHGLASPLMDSPGQSAGGGVMAVSKSRGKD